MRGEGLTELVDAIAARCAEPVLAPSADADLGRKPRLRPAEYVATLTASMVRDWADPPLEALAVDAASGRAFAARSGLARAAPSGRTHHDGGVIAPMKLPCRPGFGSHPPA